MKFRHLKHMTAIVIAALLVASLTGCGQSAASAATVSSPVVLMDTSDMFSGKDMEVGYNESECTRITLNETTAEIQGDGASVSGSTVTITQEGSYLISGTLRNGSLAVDADKQAKVRLIFDGVDIQCDTSAALYVRQADKVFVTLAKGSENTLSNAKEFVAIDDSSIDAVVFSKDDLTFNGSGTLTVNARYGHGIVSKDDLVITGGTYRITAEKKGISANNSIRVADGDITITSGTDAIHAENSEDASLGFIYISDGTFRVTAGNDGLDAAGAIQIDNGTFDVTTGGGSANASTQKNGQINEGWGRFGRGTLPDNAFDDTQNGTQQNKGKTKQTAADGSPLTVTQTAASKTADSSKTASSTASDSAKGIKSDSSVAINNGQFNLDTADDAIHSNNAVSVAGGTLSIASGDDGIHADASLAVSGGSISVTKSYEGLEGNTIDITGGTVQVTASDDGLNAAGGKDQSSLNGRPGQNEFSAQEGVYIHIAGGRLQVNANGDGIDSNGALTVSGGEVYVSGSTNNGNSALDYNGEGTVTGGTVIAAGMSGMAQNFGSGSTQASMLVSVSGTSGSTITLKDSSGKALASYAPEKDYNCIVISTPDVKKGSTYTVDTGSSSASVTMDSHIVGGNQGGMQGGMPGGNQGGMPGGNQGGGHRGGRGGRSGSRNSLPDSGTTPGSLPDSRTTPGSLPDSGTTPGSLPDNGTTPGSLPDNGTTPGSLPDNGTTPGSLPDNGTTPGSLPGKNTQPNASLASAEGVHL